MKTEGLHIKTLVCDLDGSLCNVEHRRHLLPDWDAFFRDMDLDPVIEPVAHIVRLYAQQPDIQVVLCSGRPEEYRERTNKWLQAANISYDFLFMRKTGDMRSDVVVKKEMLQEMRRREFDILFTIDDRETVVALWRREGLVCLQAAPGDFDRPKYPPGKLLILVGPSGAGKTFYYERIMCPDYGESAYISSDELREEICGDFKDMSKNNQVFTALHNIVEARIGSGLNCVVDATNIRRRDRMALLALVPADCKIEYHVIDRPMEEKMRDAGWRAEVMSHGQPLIERHAQTFQSNLREILAGDHDSRVKVYDLRHTN